MDKEQFRRKAEGFLWGVFGRRVMYADDSASRDLHVWMGLEEVTSRCTACCVPKKGGKMGNGWVDLLVMKDGYGVAGPDGQAVTKRHFGLVMWYRKEPDESPDRS